jgi:hypothetical protein
MRSCGSLGLPKSAFGWAPATTVAMAKSPRPGWLPTTTPKSIAGSSLSAGCARHGPPSPDLRTVSSPIALLTSPEAGSTWQRMLSRTTYFLASMVAVAGFAACSSPYADVYSFKKNSFKAPPAPKKEIAAPTPITDPFAGQPVAAPGTDPSAIPGLPAAAPAGIPGVDPAATPAPAPAPAPAPGAAPIPGL